MNEPILIREAVVRYRGSKRKAPTAIRRSDDVSRFVRSIVRNDAREHFVSLLLDGRHRPVGYQIVSIGTATASLVHPREVFQAAVLVGACALIVAHNHPSGDATPSNEDLDVTRRLRKAGEILGIPLLDAVVVTESGHTSLREERSDLWSAPDSPDRA